MVAANKIMKQEVVISKNPDVKQAVDELYRKLKNKKDPILVIFLASTLYDFDILQSNLIYVPANNRHVLL